MFADPQSVTYNTVAKSLVTTARGDNSSVYELNDSGVKYKLTLSHQYSKRNRVAARLERETYASDPIVPAQNILAGATVTFVMDFPNVGLLPIDVSYLAQALVDWLTDANLLKLINNET